MKYEVVVSDLGKVYEGADYLEAQRIYEDYARRSSASYGRMSKKQVMLIDSNMTIIKQHNASKRTGTEDGRGTTSSRASGNKRVTTTLKRS